MRESPTQARESPTQNREFAVPDDEFRNADHETRGQERGTREQERGTRGQERGTRGQERGTRERDEFLTGGMVPLACRSCATRVLVKKNSPQHTSIQWTTDAATSCPELAERVAQGTHPALLDTCERLRESIAEAAREGVFTHG